MQEDDQDSHHDHNPNYGHGHHGKHAHHNDHDHNLKHGLNVEKYGKHCRFILFIDLKNAYDKVIHTKLFKKMRSMNISDDIISTIEKLYSHASVRTDNRNNKINVNNGVLEGSLISPMLFNLFTYHLVEELDKNCFEVLASADDLAFVCKNMEELEKAMDNIESWSTNNGIMVNKKKSGIIVLGKEYYDSIKDYIVVKEYKYLGIILD
jgi:hypothetical protein